MERYTKQILFDRIGEVGQKKLNQSRVVIIGCGALGTVTANNLTRAGVGYIKLLDRDYIELSNLQRQVLFDEEDIREDLPKVAAAIKKLQKINSSITIEGEVIDVNSRNILRLCQEMDLIIDATDNYSIRYLINDASIRLNIPWIYGGVLGSVGMTHTIIPGKTPCLRCIFPNIPTIGVTDTCDTIGVLSTIINIIASIQTTEAIKLLVGAKEDLINKLRYFDVWNGNYEEIDIELNDNCAACKERKLEFLDYKIEEAIYLCGKDSVQVSPRTSEVAINHVISRLKRLGIEIQQNNYFIKFEVDEVTVTLFYDGRAIMKNITDVKKAQSLYARYIGL